MQPRCRGYGLSFLLVLTLVRFAWAGSVWPAPQNQTLTDRVLCLDTSKFHFKITGFPSGLLRRAMRRYEDTIFSTDSYQTSSASTAERIRSIEGCIKRLDVEVGLNDQSLNEDVDESYVLFVEAPHSYISSRTVFGALRALETFSQLVDRVGPRDDSSCEATTSAHGDTVDATIAASIKNGGVCDAEDSEDVALLDDDSTVPSVGEVLHRHHRHRHRTLFLINSTIVWDGPRFRHRGLLLDTSRHYLPKTVLQAHIDAMAMSKLNVLHWHIVDDQSFPYESDVLPLLSSMGAYSSRHVYTAADIADIVEYAKDRGVRVIPEFDTPGHTLSWGKGHPELLTRCMDEGGEPSGEMGPIDPTREDNYGLIWTLMREVAERFADKYIHLGGDEVPFDCWKSNPGIGSWMAAHNISSYSGLEGYYMGRLVSLVEAAQKSYIVWQEVVDNGVHVKSDTVVHVWKWWFEDHQPQPANDSLVESGRASESRRRLGSTGAGGAAGVHWGRLRDDRAWQQELARITGLGYRALLSAPWYLDHGNYFGEDWVSYYNVEPLSFGGKYQENALVLGGEACMWGEYVDGSNSMARVWPRAAAVAERLWASKDVRDVDNARTRLTEHRCQMVSRGLAAQPVGPGFCPADLNLGA